MIVSIQEAKKILISGGVVAIPTETVYGLGGWINSENGIKNIFQTKERPFFDPLIVHVDTIEKAKKLTSEWTPIHDILARECWPGPLTLIAKKSENLNPMITSGLDSVGLRCPDHAKTLELLSLIDGGVAAPSANKFGRTSPTTSEHVESEFNHEVPIIEGGPCQIGIESTVLGIDEKNGQYIAKIYRPGFYTSKKIKDILLKYNIEIEVEYHQSPVAPGQLEHHYMPKIPLIIVPKNYVWNNSNEKNKFSHPAFWQQPESPALASRELYAKMRDFDSQGYDVIICFENDSFENEEWRGIWNRLMKAKSYRISPI